MGRMGSGKGGRRARRQFSDEFMAGAVRLVLDEGKTVGAVAREVDLPPLVAGQLGPARAGGSDERQDGPDDRRSAPSSPTYGRKIGSCGPSGKY